MKGGDVLGNFISIREAAYIVDISETTLKRWYKWYKNDEYKKPANLKLPNYYYLDARRTKFFRSQDIEKLKEFKTKINGEHKGAMAEFNCKEAWGNRGKEIAERKELKNEE